MLEQKGKRVFVVLIISCLYQTCNNIVTKEKAKDKKPGF